MAAPSYHEETFETSMQLAHGEIGRTLARPLPTAELSTSRLGRTLSIYQSSAG